MGVSILRRESSFFAGRWKRRCTVERGGNLENGNSASFDFFQGERYRVSARGIVGIVSMVGSGFNAVPRVFYSREMEPPFVAFFLDITTFIDATPSRILVSLPPPPPPTSPCNCSFEMEREKIFHPLSSRFFMCSAFRGFFWVVSQTAYVSLAVSTAIERQIAREEAKKKNKKRRNANFINFPSRRGGYSSSVRRHGYSLDKSSPFANFFLLANKTIVRRFMISREFPSSKNLKAVIKNR